MIIVLHLSKIHQRLKSNNAKIPAELVFCRETRAAPEAVWRGSSLPSLCDSRRSTTSRRPVNTTKKPRLDTERHKGEHKEALVTSNRTMCFCVQKKPSKKKKYHAKPKKQNNNRTAFALTSPIYQTKSSGLFLGRAVRGGRNGGL